MTSPATKSIRTISAALPQPFPYQGSKRQLAGRILGYFPGHVARVIEPFAGSAAISIAAAARGDVHSFWINDRNAPLIDLWRSLLQQPGELTQAYERLWKAQLGSEREFFNKVRARFNESHQPADFLYLLARCVKAAVRYNADGEFNNSPDHRRRGARPIAMQQRIEAVHRLLGGKTRLTTWDYADVLNQADINDLIYMDPPWQGVVGAGDTRYLPSMDHDQFCEQLQQLNRRQIRYLVSYDGRTGNKVFGEPLPGQLDLQLIQLPAGRSSQATLLGRRDETVESLYLSPALAGQLTDLPNRGDLRI